jgi:hypothetical protein
LLATPPVLPAERFSEAQDHDDSPKPSDGQILRPDTNDTSANADARIATGAPACRPRHEPVRLHPERDCFRLPLSG